MNTKAQDLIKAIQEEQKPVGFSSTIHGFSFVVSDAEGSVVDRKIISIVDVDDSQKMLGKLQEAIDYINRFRDKQIDLTEPVL